MCIDEYLHFQTAELLDEEIFWHLCELLDENIENSVFGQLFRHIKKQTIKDLK